MVNQYKKFVNVTTILIFIFVLSSYGLGMTFEESGNEAQAYKYLGNISCNFLKKQENYLKEFEIPKKIPFQNENLQIYLEEDFFGEIIIKEGHLNKFNCEKIEKPTYKIYIEESSTFSDLIENFQTETLKEKLHEEKIRVEGVGIMKKIKWFFSKIAIKWFI